MRDPRPGERRLTCVLKRPNEACAGWIDVIVDEGFVDDVQGITGSVYTAVTDAVTNWLAQQEMARTIIATEYEGNFNFGDLVHHLGGGYDDQSAEELLPTDIERYLMIEGIKAMEVDAIVASDPETGDQWLYDDCLFDEETVKESNE